MVAVVGGLSADTALTVLALGGLGQGLPPAGPLKNRQTDRQTHRQSETERQMGMA